MPVTTLEAQRKIEKLEREVRQLRSFVIGQIGRDPEGEYRPEFVTRILKIAKSKPVYTYTGRGSFLKLLKKSR